MKERKPLRSQKRFIMASMKILIIATILALVVPPALAKEFVVGDDKGWTIGFDYQAWAEGKDFRVGDTLVFKYPEEAHNVHKVDETAFQQCVAPASSEALKSGNDVITLGAPGRKWYICGVGQHCDLGKQKLFITVLAQVDSPTISPTAPPSAATDITASKFYIMIAAAIAIFMTVMF